MAETTPGNISMKNFVLTPYTRLEQIIAKIKIIPTQRKNILNPNPNQSPSRNGKIE